MTGQKESRGEVREGRTICEGCGGPRVVKGPERKAETGASRGVVGRAFEGEIVVGDV